MNEKKLTIIMTNYNQEKFIEKAIDSVLNQITTFDYELIITDDNSIKDNSKSIIQKYAEKYPDKINAIFNIENKKYLGNVLNSMNKIKTEYFCLLDADDYYTDNNFLERAVSFLEKNKDYSIYYENVNVLKDDNITPLIDKKFRSGTYSFDDYLNNKISFSQTTGEVFRNIVYKDGIPDTILKSIGTVNERSYEGDTFRFIVHLEKGLAYYSNNICGVYRMLKENCIWANLLEIEKNILNMQLNLDVNFYFNCKYSSYYDDQIRKYYYRILQDLTYLDKKTSEKYLKQFSDMYLTINVSDGYRQYYYASLSKKDLCKAIILKLRRFIKKN